MTEVRTKLANSSSRLTFERRIATALWNCEERERIVAMKAFKLFSARGGEHGSDLDDWLQAERELALGDVVIDQLDQGIELIIWADHTEPGHVVLSISSESVLILWTNSEGKIEMQDPTLGLVPLSHSVDPEKAEVEYRDGRVSLRLPYAVRDHSSQSAGVDVRGIEGKLG